MSLSAPAPASVLAFFTTAHIALVVLRAHRGPQRRSLNPVTTVSALLVASPWLLTSPVGLGLGLAAHLGWFTACERLLPAARATAPVRRPAPAAPAVAPRPIATGGRPRRPPQFVQTPVLSMFDETPDIRTFRFVRPEGFDFTPGQFVAVRVRADGTEHVRCYSISSSPDARGYLEISIKRLGLVSSTLHATLRPGSTIAVRSPAGAFVYPGDEDRPLVLLAGGIGITPLMSMLRHALHNEPMRPVTLLYSVRTEEDIAYREELEFLDFRHPQFRFVVAVTDAPAGGTFVAGRIDADLIRRKVPDVGHAVSLVCGPKGMIEAMTGTLAAMGVPAPQIRHEVFEAAVAASAGAAKPATEIVPIAGGAHRMEFSRSGQTTTVDGGQTMLEAAEACGADIPSLCRAGVCGTCRTRVLSGDVECASTLLDDQDRQEGFVLACVTRVRSDCTVEA